MSPVPINDKEDPNKEDENQDISAMEAPQFILPAGSSDSEDEEDPSYQGYQLLPQDAATEDAEAPAAPEPSHPDDVFDSVVRSSVDAQDFICSSGTNSLFDVAVGADDETEQRAQVWNAPVETKREPMDQAHVEQIRAAMAGFTLPAPDWAKVIPEEEWKTRIVSKVKESTGPGPSKKS